MRFALLGNDEDAAALARAAEALGHQVVRQGDEAESPSPGGAWEELLDAESCDGIFVGAGADEQLRLRQLQELIKLGRPVLTTFPLFASVLSYFEVDMSRGESGSVVRHFNRVAAAPLAKDLAAWIRDGHPEFGRVEQINCVRQLRDRSQRAVERSLARDVEMLEQAAGRLDRIGAHGGAGEAAYSALGVQLLGLAELPLRWTVEPAGDREQLVVHVVAERGRTDLIWDAISNHEGGPTEDAAAIAAIEGFAQAIGNAEMADDQSTWDAALHAMELVDSIEISLRRGRMIDVHSPQLTEHLAFKGTMAAAGCGVLLVLIPAALLVGGLASLMGVPVAKYWPHALLTLLTAFLLLQLLPLLLPARKPNDHD